MSKWIMSLYCHLPHLSSESAVSPKVWLPREKFVCWLHVRGLQLKILKKEFDFLIFFRLNEQNLISLSLEVKLYSLVYGLFVMKIQCDIIYTLVENFIWLEIRSVAVRIRKVNSIMTIWQEGVFIIKAASFLRDKNYTHIVCIS